MDPHVTIISKEETDEGWEFVVEVKSRDLVTQHTVTVDEEYFEQFNFDGPEEMVLASFYFLIEHENLEEILPAFDLHIIADFFPNYESEVEEYL